MTSPAVLQAQTARRWSRLHPQLAPAIARALALVGGVSRVAPDHYEVEGASETYRVRVYPEQRRATCSCPAWQYAQGQQARCKHTLAVALVTAVETDTQQETT